MKKLILAALLITGISVTGFSQDRARHTKKTPEQRAQFMTDAMDKKLSLSDKQRSEIYKVHLDRARDMEKNHSEAMKRGEKDRSKMKGQFEASEKKIDRILNSSQKKAYAELKAQRHEKGKHHKAEFKRGQRNKEGKLN